MQHLDPQMQQILQQMTSKQMNQAVNASPQLQQALQNQVQVEDVQAKVNDKKIQYLLDKSQEEASEIIQAVSKIRRFGSDNHHPDRETTNKQELVGELEDFLAIIAVLEGLGYVDLSQSKDKITEKARVLMK